MSRSDLRSSITGQTLAFSEEVLQTVYEIKERGELTIDQAIRVVELGVANMRTEALWLITKDGLDINFQQTDDWIKIETMPFNA